MAPFFTREIIDRFLFEFRKYSGLEILTNEDDHERLQPILPIIMENASEICRGSIGDTYLENTIMDNAFGVDTIFDTAILLENGDPVPIGFIVVEKGECKRRGYENVWSVNLICAKETSRGGKSGLGQILMGLYLYTISHNDSIQPKTAILELANGYINAGGLASYMKLGFVVDESLYGRNCFEDYGNLPMAVRELHPTRIIAILNGEDAGYPKLPICNIRGDLQLYLGLCKNLYTFIEKNAEEYIDSKYELADKRIINFDLLETKLYEEFARLHNIAGKKRKKTNIVYNEWLKAYITNIETNHSTLNTGDLIGFSLLHKTGRTEGLVTPAAERKKAEVLVNMERRLRSGLRIDILPAPITRQRSHGGRSNSGRSKRNKKSKQRKTRKA
jgi:hypothetical protein